MTKVWVAYDQNGILGVYTSKGLASKMVNLDIEVNEGTVDQITDYGRSRHTQYHYFTERGVLEPFTFHVEELEVEGAGA